MHLPRFRSCYRCEVVPSVGVFLLSEARQFMLQGPAYVHLAPLLDGRHGVDDLVALLDGKVSAPEVYYALELLQRKGYLTDASVPLAPEQVTFWELLGVDPQLAAQKLAETTVSVTAIGDLDPAPFQAQLEELGIHVVRQDGLRHVVLTDDHTRQELQALNAEALERNRPWMLIRPVGLDAWLGPIFVPHKTGCWACLEHRLVGHRKLERYLSRSNGLSGSFIIPRATMPSFVHAALGLAATETAKWIAQENTATLEGKLVTIHAATLETQTHVLTRRPQCSACGDPAIVSTTQLRPIELSPTKTSFAADGGHRAAPPEETLARIEHHVSPITGVVARLTPLGAGDRNFKLAYIADHNFAHSHDGLFFVRKGQRSRSGGKGKTEVQARMSALGEAIERYSGLFQGDEARVRARLGDLNEAAIHPNQIMLYSERQLGEHADTGSWYNRIPQPFDVSQEIEWSPLWPLLGGPVRYAPTALCYYSYGQSPAPYGRADSNGCAAGTCMEEAVYQGLLELVERDCTAMWWYNRLRRPGVDLASFDDPYFGRDRSLLPVDWPEIVGHRPHE